MPGITSSRFVYFAGHTTPELHEVIERERKLLGLSRSAFIHNTLARALDVDTVIVTTTEAEEARHENG